MMKKKILALGMVACLAATAVVGGTLAYFTDTDTVENTFTAGNVKLDLFEHGVDNPNEEVESNDYTATAIMPGREFAKDPTIRIKKGSEDSYVFLDMTLNRYKSLVPVMALDAAADVNINFDDSDVADCMVNGKFSTLTFLNKMKGEPDTFRDIIDKWFLGINHSDWEICGFFYDTDKDDTTAKGNWMTIRFAYIGTEDYTLSAEDTVTFMTAFQMPASVTQEMIENGLTANQFNAEGTFNLNFKAYAIQADTIAADDAFEAMFGTELGSYWYPVK